MFLLMLVFVVLCERLEVVALLVVRFVTAENRRRSQHPGCHGNAIRIGCFRQG
jgi:hypothetical protein